jgi:uncharacterized OsmC-like protein
MRARARTFTYEIAVDPGWVATSSRGGTPLPSEEEAWTPEHLLLAALVRCSLTSFRYHARRAGLEPVTSAGATGSVTQRESDGRFALVEVDVHVDVRLDDPPGPDALRDIVAKGERDCFVGASLTVVPTYHWTVNGEDLS